VCPPIVEFSSLSARLLPGYIELPSRERREGAGKAGCLVMAREGKEGMGGKRKERRSDGWGKKK